MKTKMTNQVLREVTWEWCGETYKGYLHEFYLGENPIALVESETGQVEVVCASHIRFVVPYKYTLISDSNRRNKDELE